MKKVLLIFFILSIYSFGQIKKTNSYNRFYVTKHIDINQIDAALTNLGKLDINNYYPGLARWKAINYRDYITGRNLNLNNTIVYDQGIWLHGKINNEIHAANSTWSTSFSPGPIINNQPAMLYNPSDSMKYGIYKITKGDNNDNPDYASWPVDFGAPTDDNGNPLIKGDQTLWTVFNCADSSTLKYQQWFRPNNERNLLPIEVQQLAFARKGNKKDNEDIFSNTIFFEYTIINKGSVKIDSAFIGFWTDIDFLAASYNPPGVDTSAQVGYCWYNYNGEQTDYYYNIHRAPTAVGYTLLYGPSVISEGNNSIFKGRKINNHKNLPMTSFHGIGDDSAYLPYDFARSIYDSWNLALGLQTNGLPYINPSTNQITKFQLTGDPITNTGWVWPFSWTGGGAGFAMFSGPFNLAPQDTQWVMIALTPAMGNNKFESIKILRDKANLLRSIPYDSLAYGTTPYKLNYVDTTNIDDIVEREIIPDKLELTQNFPNPFNPETTIIFGLPTQSFVTLKIYDILGRVVTTLVSENKNAGTYRIHFNSSGLASGIYFYRITAGSFSEIKKMVLLK